MVGHGVCCCIDVCQFVVVIVIAVGLGFFVEAFVSHDNQPFVDFGEEVVEGECNARFAIPFFVFRPKFG